MVTKRSFLLFVAMAVTTSTSFAQFVTGGGETTSSTSSSTKAWASFKLPKKNMKLDFRNANVDMVLELFQKESGITIVKDPALTGPFTLTTAKAVPISDAFATLSAALSLRNFDLQKQDNLLVIKQRPARQTNNNNNPGGWGGRGGNNMGGGFQMPQGMDLGALLGGGQQAQTELRVYPIKYASASQVARVLNEVFTQQAQANMGGFPMMMMGGAQRGGRGGFNFGNLGGLGGGGGSQVRASADDFSNSVIVNAPTKEHRQVSDLLKEIDKQTEAPSKAQVYPLKFANATDLQPVILNLLISNQPQGRGNTSASTGQPVDRQFSFFGGGGNQNRQQNAAVTAEVRTNSLIVTTTEANQDLVKDVITELDKEVKLESTTFVFPLDNAKSDDIATLLRNTFGTRSGTGGTRTNTGTTNQNRNNRNTNSGRTGNAGRTGGLQSFNENEIQLNLDDPDRDSGELETVVGVQGGFFGGFGGQQNTQNRQNQQPLGRNAQGQLVPTQDLTNQVTVISDPNTNSIIVVTNPENADVIRQILGQLDKIPEQVMIETIIVEASLDKSSKFGVEWKFNQAKAFGSQGVTGTAEQNFGLGRVGEGMRYSLGGGNLDLYLNAMEGDDSFKVLSTPRIFTSNNVQAEINISQRVPYVVSQREDANGNLTFNYDFEDVGIVLTVTPRITSNGYVTMDVTQTANDLQGFTDFNAPIVNQREAQTTVAVKDGDTIILGGIMRNSVTTSVKKIPLLGDIPIFGNLFKSTSKESSKTELLVFLRPRVVRNPDDASKLREKLQNEMSKGTQEQLKKVIEGAKDEKKVDPPKVDPPKKEGGN